MRISNSPAAASPLLAVGGHIARTVEFFSAAASRVTSLINDSDNGGVGGSDDTALMIVGLILLMGLTMAVA